MDSTEPRRSDVIDPQILGRGKSKLVIEGQRIIKTAPKWEPFFMRRHRTVFVPVLWCDHDRNQKGGTGAMTRYAMPLCTPPTPADLENALTSGARKLHDLWVTPRQGATTWHVLLENHLKLQITAHHLAVDHRKLDVIMRGIRGSRNSVEIHGDPTLANIVHDGETWRWIDPLNRIYIPGDPHVDLGKMFQSCLGYEQALFGLIREERYDLMRQLAQQCKLSYELGKLWCYIHIVRLLPYQDDRVRRDFERVLGAWK